MRAHVEKVKREWRLATALVLVGVLLVVAITVRGNDLTTFNRQTCDRIDTLANVFIKRVLANPPKHDATPAQVREYGQLLADLQAATC